MKTQLKITGLCTLLILIAATSVIWLAVWIITGFDVVKYIINKIRKLENW